METIQLETFAFQILNQLCDEFNLHPDDYKVLANQIWNARTISEMDKILSFLKASLLICMRNSV